MKADINNMDEVLAAISLIIVNGVKLYLLGVPGILCGDIKYR